MTRRLQTPILLTLLLFAGLFLVAAPAQAQYIVVYSSLWQSGSSSVSAMLNTDLYGVSWCEYYWQAGCVYWYDASVSGVLKRDSVTVDSNSATASNWTAGIYLYDEMPGGQHYYDLDGTHIVEYAPYSYYWDYMTNFQSTSSYQFLNASGAGPPPWVSYTDTSGALRGTSGYLTVYGQNLSSSPSIQADGSGLWMSVSSVWNDTQIQAYYSIDANATSGAHYFTVATSGGTTGNVQFNVLDPSPHIDSISPETWEAGSTVPVTITGSGFGGSPTVDAGTDVSVSVTSSTGTQINAMATVWEWATAGGRTVTVTSNGWGGSGFMPAPGGGGASTSGTVTVTAGAPPPTTLSLERTSLSTIWAYGNPTPGSYSWTRTSSTGSSPPYLQWAPGVNQYISPNPIVVVAPSNPDPRGQPSPGGLGQFTAQYYSSSGQAQKSFGVATFGVSCYIIAREDDYWGPSECGSLTIDGVLYSGWQTDPPGLSGTFCRAFVADTKLQGSGIAHDGTKIKFAGTRRGDRYEEIVGEFKTYDGEVLTENSAGRVVARSLSIIPAAGVKMDLVGIAEDLSASDTGGKITGYRLDLFKGIGRYSNNCASGWTNPIVVGACSPGNSNCPQKNVN
jgi:3D (Asp-Asp-Asp) domain-containing protein